MATKKTTTVKEKSVSLIKASDPGQVTIEKLSQAGIEMKLNQKDLIEIMVDNQLRNIEKEIIEFCRDASSYPASINKHLENVEEYAQAQKELFVEEIRHIFPSSTKEELLKEVQYYPSDYNTKERVLIPRPVLVKQEGIQSIGIRWETTFQLITRDVNVKLNLERSEGGIRYNLEKKIKHVMENEVSPIISEAMNNLADKQVNFKILTNKFGLKSNPRGEAQTYCILARDMNQEAKIKMNKNILEKQSPEILKALEKLLSSTKTSIGMSTDASSL